MSERVVLIKTSSGILIPAVITRPEMNPSEPFLNGDIALKLTSAPVDLVRDDRMVKLGHPVVPWHLTSTGDRPALSGSSSTLFQRGRPARRIVADLSICDTKISSVEDDDTADERLSEGDTGHGGYDVRVRV